MSSLNSILTAGYTGLRAGEELVSKLRDGVSTELLALFLDDMHESFETTIDDYYGNPATEPEPICVHLLRAPGAVLRDRLDLVGITERSALDTVDELLRASLEHAIEMCSDDQFAASRDLLIEEVELLRPYTADRWADELRAHGPGYKRDRGRRLEVGSREWLLAQIDYMEPRWALRCALAAWPEAEVSLDLTELYEIETEPAAWSTVTSLRESPSAAAANVLRQDASTNVPVIVLVEGRTDAEFLSAGLQVLYPHLTDLIRFMDYSASPEGGAAMLVKNIRAFAAAGVANRLVGIFDNDTAARDAMRSLEGFAVPDNIAILQYPALKVLESYPAVGPPAGRAQESTTVATDVNGLAGSIELYLGFDVLRDEDGQLRPVQWKSYFGKLHAYHGEVTGKREIHDSFRTKVRVARTQPEAVLKQDWNAMQQVLDSVRVAASQLATGGGLAQ